MELPGRGIQIYNPKLVPCRLYIALTSPYSCLKLPGRIGSGMTRRTPGIRRRWSAWLGSQFGGLPGTSGTSGTFGLGWVGAVFEARVMGLGID